MALNFLVDTSVLKRISQPLVRQTVEPLAARGELARTSICDLEIGYSARNVDEWDQLIAALDTFLPVETKATHIHRALQVQRLLAKKRQRARKIPDLLVAAAAEEMAITVLHYDADFDLIAGVTGQSTQWVVPAGQAD
jgi:predicted nucleic acid-binding protein